MTFNLQCFDVCIDGNSEAIKSKTLSPSCHKFSFNPAAQDQSLTNTGSTIMQMLSKLGRKLTSELKMGN